MLSHTYKHEVVTFPFVLLHKITKHSILEKCIILDKDSYLNMVALLDSVPTTEKYFSTLSCGRYVVHNITV